MEVVAYGWHYWYNRLLISQYRDDISPRPACVLHRLASDAMVSQSFSVSVVLLIRANIALIVNKLSFLDKIDNKCEDVLVSVFADHNLIIV